MSRLHRNSLRVLRFGLALILFATCLGKALDVEGFIHVIQTYQFFPVPLAPLIGIGIVTAEGALAVWLFSGRHVALTAVLASVLHLGFVGLAVVTLIRGISVPNCGCFGVFLARPLTWGTVAEDLFMAAWCLGLYFLSDRKLRAI